MLGTNPQRDEADSTRPHVPDHNSELAASLYASDSETSLTNALNSGAVSTSLPVRTARYSAPSEDAAPLTTEAEAQPTVQGRIELLPSESVVHQLGAIYLTNKRVLLYAPNLLRTTSLRDVDAVGAAYDRLNGAIFALGLALTILSALFGGLVFFERQGDLTGSALLDLLQGVRGFFQAVLPLPFLAILLGVAAIGIFFIVSYFLWLGRSLFISVHGRPLISVSISGYRPKRLEDVDAFINALWLAKDRLENGSNEGGG